MSFRQDKLILLIETGTSTQVRRTAAKQLADLTCKTFRFARPEQAFGSEVKEEATSTEDVKPEIVGIGEATETVTLHAAVSEDEAWAEVLETISKLVPLLRSKSTESRNTAAHALGLLAANLPPYTSPVSSSSELDTPPVNLVEVLKSETLLLASAGKEYVARNVAGDKAKRRRAMMGTLGLDEGMMGDDMDKMLGDEEETEASSSKTQQAPPPKDIFEGLSARQITLIKRKKGNMVEEANKMRRLNQRSSGTEPTPSASATPTPLGSPSKTSTPLPEDPNSVVINPGAKAAQASGGQVDPILDADGKPVAPKQTPQIRLETGHSPWTCVLFELVPQLGDPSWLVRHGSAMAIMEILRSFQSAHVLLPVARHLLTLLALDRFGDFLGDTVVAPVRETASQALGVCLKYMSPPEVLEIHAVLREMIRQDWVKRGEDAEAKWEKFSWEVRHAGLLALKYEVALRVDMLQSSVKGEDVKTETDGVTAEAVIDLWDVVECALLGFTGDDDDVRTVAANTLEPIAERLAAQLPQEQLGALNEALWQCLNDADELGSSVGATLDLLGALIQNEQYIALLDEVDDKATMMSRIYPFSRHPIVSVRRSVATVLHRFVTVPEFDRSTWMYPDFMAHVFENIILEQNADIRETSARTLKAGFKEVESESGEGAMVSSTIVQNGYNLVMTAIGKPLPTKDFVALRRPRTGHDVDKPMKLGDLSLVDEEIMWTTRIEGAQILGLMRKYQDEDDAQDLEQLREALESDSAHEILMACIIIHSWAQVNDASSKTIQRLGVDSEEAVGLVELLTKKIESPAPSTYTEMDSVLQRLRTDTEALLTSFEGKVPQSAIPRLPSLHPTKKSKDVFTMATAQDIVQRQFDEMVNKLPAKSPHLAALQERRQKVFMSMGLFAMRKERYDARVGAGIAAALLALRAVPEKHGPVVRAVMNSIKTEESPILQSRAAAAVASFISYVQTPFWNKPINAPDKVIQNLFTYIHSDPAVCPVFTLPSDPAQTAAHEGIVTLREDRAAVAEANNKKKNAVAPEETEDQRKRRITRRGALMAFKGLAEAFGDELWDMVPQVWNGLSSALLSTYGQDSSIESVDQTLSTNKEAGQKVIDALTSLRFIAPDLSPSLHKRLEDLLPAVISGLQSSSALIRNAAAQSLATLCDVMTDAAMKVVVDSVVPLIGDAKRTAARQGGVEAVHHIIKLLDIRALPYVLFLIVPILGRMSDPDEHVRLLSTSTFASLIQMVPLEAGLPDPPGFSPEMLARRDEERQFLMQLLDGSKAEQYQIPIEIKADLRQYQKDGVSWLAFLAKYQLHGILCDDMGLGKSLQTICIIGSKHHERAAKHRATGSVDSGHLPSLIVCPPTLTGHWYYEISKFTSDLTAIQYVGSTAARAALRPSLTKYDIVITSYETVRADIDALGQIDWLYCALDEGHVIKNAKTKLSAAVKQIRAQHRLLLSGTPIQNNLLELWSLFDFLMPGFLGTERQFQDKFGKPVMADREGKATAKEREAAATALESLHKQVLPFLLRRLKEDVLSDLPPKIIQDYYCDLSPLQSVLYDEFAKSRAAEEAGEEVAEGEKASAGQGHVFQSLQYLRKLCNHPALVVDPSPDGTQKLDSLRDRAGIGRDVGVRDVTNAPKLLALRQLLHDCGIGLPVADKMEESPGHRVLIFCQLRPMIDLIETTLFAQHMPSVTYMRMDGSTDTSKRHAIVQTFNADPRIDVLLLTTSVGGLGLNLTGADTVIFVDHDWNPMKDLQAMDRAHRLGQRRVVNVYRLIMRGTLEEKIMGLQRFKLNIASSVVTQQNAGLGSMNTGEVLDLFKVSAEGESGKAKKAVTGTVSASKVLEGLEDLPPDDEYAELSLSNFLSKV